MDRAGTAPAQVPAADTSTTENPIVAVGRKVKSVLSTSQRPSVRIIRKPPSAGDRRLPASGDVSEKHGAGNGAATTRSHAIGARNSAGGLMRSWFGRAEDPCDQKAYVDEYDPDTVDLLDVLDPEVSTLSTLTNVQNSLFVPSLGRLLDRRPAYRLVDEPKETRLIDKVKAKLKLLTGQEKEPVDELGRKGATGPSYAVLPEGETLSGWSQDQRNDLNDLVRHMLHSRRAKLKRSIKGFGQYVRRPLGLFITVYATLITLFGAAWVLFLIGWISIGSKRDYVVNVVDNVLVALFAIIGDGLAPFRAVDTYHMIYIAYYHRVTWKKREKMGLPDLVDHNDLPEHRKDEVEPKQVDLESLVARRLPRRFAKHIARRMPNRLAQRFVSHSDIKDPSYEYSVLTVEQQTKLEHHERKFSKSHTFYKPHETETHFAFPLKLLVAVVILLDLHSCLQITLGACTWGISYKTRPFALTTVILCCSITCNIMGGVLISIGDKRTRKTDVIERMMRQELTADAIDELRTRWMREAEDRGELDPAVRTREEEARERAENEEIKKSWKYVFSLPKHLLGKGEDHRQPSLPQQARHARTRA
ncbi:hypothetical protein K461DRAFT_321238 [Myriangium duriaei CBS 260.36]|uniref:Integral membrane protein n=1 Tax=Myriangium duriaei CBS 260.36 TaxID=1168546 RepID=A0A9P4J540_9PEZI|nr:hypothetical protein K461DRAFT_321238 [Myriangium duriaei CBS 260.36]